MEDWRRIDIDKYDPDLQYEPDSNGYPIYHFLKFKQRFKILEHIFQKVNLKMVYHMHYQNLHLDQHNKKLRLNI
ncbi:unnamed protein product [[Candida] boidinii]|nr:unnamed protein product [[Candida] boidinii]